MNRNYICVYDFETTSKKWDSCQPTQIASVMIEPRKLEIVEGSVFNSLIKPEFDEEKCKALNLDPPTEQVLKLTHKTPEELQKAPILKQVWGSFVDYAKKYNVGTSGWDLPVRAGFNIFGYDNKIMDRLAKEFGPYDDEYKSQKAFHPLHSIDIMNFMWMLTENARINKTNSISMDNLRIWLGMPKDGAHDALNDVIDCAELLIRIIKLNRKVTGGMDCVHCKQSVKVKLQGSLAGFKRPSL